MTMLPNRAQQNATESFETFYESWLVRHEHLLEELLSAKSMLNCSSSNEIEKQRKLIDQALTHYQQYMEEKSKLTNDDVFILSSPTWLSPYERSLLWIGDYKPTLILRLADGAVEGLTAEQREELESVKYETKRKEREVTEAMAEIQESLASPRLLRLARLVLDGEITEVDSAIEGMKRAMVTVTERADQLRATTVRTVVEILSPPQTVQFLAATMHFQLRVRKWGNQKDEMIGPPQ